MGSLPIEEQEKALTAMLQARVWRQRGGISEEEIAERLLFESAEHMYRHMKDEWGWPDWAVYPEPPKPKRRAKGSIQEPSELPPANNAAPLLKSSIAKLNDALDELPFLRQWLKDGRFVTERVLPKESGLAYETWRKVEFERRSPWDQFRGDDDLFSIKVHPEAWEKWCKHFGQDPQAEEFKLPFTRVDAEGATRYSPDRIVQLVAMHAVTGGTVEDLVDKLHLDNKEPNWKKIKETESALLLAAQHLATWVQGGVVRAGSPIEPVPPDEHRTYRTITGLEDDGALETLALWLKTLPPEEAKRIKNLRLPYTGRNDV